MKTVITLALAGAALFGAAPAGADTQSYLNRLEYNDLVDFTGLTTAYVNTGYQVCTARYAGASAEMIIQSLDVNYRFDRTASEELYYLAVEELC